MVLEVMDNTRAHKSGSMPARVLAERLDFGRATARFSAPPVSYSYLTLAAQFHSTGFEVNLISKCAV